MNKRSFWLWLVTITSLFYILWRLLFTIPIGFGIFSFIIGILLFISELTSVIEIFIHFFCMHREYEPELPIINDKEYPEVDILIATHSENVDLLFKTVNGCLHLDYPNKDKIHIYLCDDGNRAEVRELAKDMGVSCIQLQNNRYAKAGNLNNAIERTHSPLIVTLDADMIPQSNFLMLTVPYFLLPRMIKENGIWRKRTEKEIDENYKIGYIQTPQSFYNPDLFQFNFFAENSIPNEQYYFFHNVNIKKNTSNSAIYAGSNTIISRKALEDVGGIKIDTITEDFATGIEIEAKGYTCYAIKRTLASGLAPKNFSNLIKQRQRWARGCIQIMRGKDFWKNKLSLKSKLSYLSCLLYWWTFLRRIIYIFSPILYSVFGILIVDASLKELALIWLPFHIIYNNSISKISGNMRNQKWCSIVDTILCPYMIIPIIAETLGIRMKKFSVTSKAKDSFKSAKIMYAIPHIILLIADILGLVLEVYRMIYNKELGGVVIVYWLTINGYYLFMATIFMIGRMDYKESERFYADIMMNMYCDESIIETHICDISEGGFSFELSFPKYFDGKYRFTLYDEKRKAEVYGKIVNVITQKNKWKYCVRLTDNKKIDYYELIYDRCPSLATEYRTKGLEDFVNYIKKRKNSKFKPQTLFPIIDINKSFSTDNGDCIWLIDYSYRYFAIDDTLKREEIGLVIDSNAIILRKVKYKDKLYEIENWKEMIPLIERVITMS